jgi:hypothetical protein
MRYFKFLLLVFTLAIVSCSKDEARPSLCPDGGCDGSLFIPFPKDSNGYYHVDLDFNGEYLPRFDIYIEGDDVDPFYYYNDIGVVQAAFESSSYWVMDNGVEVDLVQNTTFYLNNSPSNNEYIPTSPSRKWGKRIVGPIHPQFIGDTITIRAEIYWDGGSKSMSQLFEEKFIVE